MSDDGPLSIELLLRNCRKPKTHTVEAPHDTEREHQTNHYLTTDRDGAASGPKRQLSRI